LAKLKLRSLLLLVGKVPTGMLLKLQSLLKNLLEKSAGKRLTKSLLILHRFNEANAVA